MIDISAGIWHIASNPQGVNRLNKVMIRLSEYGALFTNGGFVHGRCGGDDFTAIYVLWTAGDCTKVKLLEKNVFFSPKVFDVFELIFCPIF